MRRRLFFGVTAISLVVLVIGVVLASGVNRRFRSEVRDDLFRQAEATAFVVGEQLGAALERRDAATDSARPVLETIETVRRIGGHDIVEVGLVIGDRVRTVSPATVLLPDEPPRVTRELYEQQVDGTAMAVAIVVIDIDVGSRDRSAVVAIGRSTDLPGSGLGFALVVSLGVGALLAIGLAAWLARSTGRSVDDLGAAARALAGGEFAVRAPESGIVEVADLGRAFNEMAEHLEESRRREREFLMNVSHDLRTPLTSIRGYGEALAGGDVADTDLAHVGDVVSRQADRLGRLVDDLMTLGRLEAGQFTVYPETVQLSAHLTETVAPFVERARELGIRVATSITEVGEVRTDPDRVAQMLGNLMENAMRHTPEGGSIEVALGVDAEVVVISVADTGPGIEPEDLSQIFDRNYVADRQRPVRPEGSGLGLTITRELASLLGGTVGVDSVPGSGSTFSVRLPRQ